MSDERRCPECGRPYWFRVARRLRDSFSLGSAYRCDGPAHVYVHRTRARNADEPYPYAGATGEVAE